MNRFMELMKRTFASLAAAIEPLLSPEVFLADLKLSRSKVNRLSWRKPANPSDRVLGAWKRLPGSVHQGLAFTLVLCFMAMAAFAPREAYTVTLVDELTGARTHMGILHDGTQVDAWLEQFSASQHNPKGYELHFTPQVEVAPISWAGSYSNPLVLKQSIFSSLHVFTEASIIHISDKIELPVVNAQAVNQVLDNVRLHYVDENKVSTVDVDFIDDIVVMRQPVDPSIIISVEEATDILLQGSPRMETHVIQSGDSLWDIAMSLASANPSMDVDDALQKLEEANPVITYQGFPQIGETLVLPTGQVPLLGVTTTETIEVTESIAFGVETKYSDDMFRYEQVVERYGVPGELVVQYKITSTNGIEIARSKVSEYVVSEPSVQIEVRGTKQPDDRGSGAFIWPLRGYLSDRFGWRSLGYHRGQDISSGGYGTIVAADGGIVTHAGWADDGLGISVTIDHRNGFVTRYGHLSQVYVSYGDGVTQGTALGVEGNTGYSFGTHLHFEIIVNGSHVDPMNYLP